MPTLRRDDWGLSWIWKLVALVIIGAVLAGTYSTLFGSRGPPSPPALNVAESGDAVQLDYTGYFDDGRVFDTSVWDVATDNATYPKSPGFSIRTRAQYAPLDFFVDGGTGIQGVNKAALGVRVGQARTPTVPPAPGEGPGCGGAPGAPTGGGRRAGSSWTTPRTRALAWSASGTSSPRTPAGPLARPRAGGRGVSA